MARIIKQILFCAVILLSLGCPSLWAQPLSSTVASEEFAIKEKVDVLSPGILLGESGYTACLVEFHAAGSYTFVIIAHAENPEQHARLQVLVNKKIVTTIQVPASSYSSYTFVQELSAGFHEIGFRVPNADRQGGILLASLTVLPSKGLERVTMLDMESYRRKQYDRTERPLEEAKRRIDTIRKGMLHFRVLDENDQPVPGAVVHVVQKRHEFPFGIQVPDLQHLTEDDITAYTQFSDYLNSVSLPGFCLGWSQFAPEEGTFDFTLFDQWASIFRKTGYRLRAGCLFPEKEADVPSWAREAKDKQLSSSIKLLSRLVAVHARKLLQAIDVMTLNGGYLMDRLGPGVCRQILHEIHVANPALKCFVHACSELDSSRTAGLSEQFRRQTKKGAAFDGLSVMARMASDHSPHQIKDALDEFMRIKKPVILQGPLAKDGAVLNNAIRTKFYRMAFSHPAISGLYAGGCDPLQDNAAEETKNTLMSCRVLSELIENEWWTDEKRVTNRKGGVSIHAFFGQHRVAVLGPGGQHVNVTVRFPGNARNLNLVIRLAEQQKPQKQPRRVQKKRRRKPVPVKKEEDIFQPVPQ